MTVWIIRVYVLFGMYGVDMFIKYTEYTVVRDLHIVQMTRRGKFLPFLFSCRRCGAILYRDPKPVLRDGTYRRETYLESVVTKIGGKCPYCGHKLQVPPTTIEVSNAQPKQVEQNNDGNVDVFHITDVLPDLRTRKKVPNPGS